MTYIEWATTIERGVTITPEMAFASRDAEIESLRQQLAEINNYWQSAKADNEQKRISILMMHEAIREAIDTTYSDTLHTKWNSLIAATEQKP